jgi:protein SCO1/2
MSHEPIVRRTAVLVALAALLVVVAGLLVARGDDEPSRTGDDDGSWAGTVLPEPQEKPAIQLTTTQGEPFDLLDATEGKLTLLMFGYTNCPDVCPINLATLEAALEELGPEMANGVEVVFITADPERDTPEVLRSYLDSYSTEFVGLTGEVAEVEQAQRLAQVPVAILDEPDARGGYTVGHATQIIAYQEDGTARTVYPFGTRQQDWIRDLPRLIDGERPAQ